MLITRPRTELRKVLEAVPCCATRKDGTGENDALNFFVIGDTDNIILRVHQEGMGRHRAYFGRLGLESVQGIFLRGEIQDLPHEQRLRLQAGPGHRASEGEVDDTRAEPPPPLAHARPV